MSNLCEFMPFRGIVYLSFWGRMLDLKLLFFFFFFLVWGSWEKIFYIRFKCYSEASCRFTLI